MRRALVAVLALGCTLPHLTKYRGGINNCTNVQTGPDGKVSCGQQIVATVECYLPRQETCTALAVRYPDGERVFLYEPTGFNPAHSEEAAADTQNFALRPQIAEDGTFIWFRRSDSRFGSWEAYEMDTGAVYTTDGRGVIDAQHRHGAKPLWTLPDAGKEAAQ